MNTPREPVDSLVTRLDALERDIDDTRALAARVYERREVTAARLEELRREPGYEQPFERTEPLVSVRVATYNNAEILTERTLPTLLTQTYRNWEAIVVGDAVTDDTEERIRSIGDPRIRFLNLPFRGPYPDDPEQRWMVAGTGPANVALQLATGDWIAALDDDDEWAPDHIEVLLERAQREQAEIAYGKLQYVDAGTGARLPLDIGTFPPRLAQFSFLAAVVHCSLREFTFDPLAYLAGEPGDWNLCRRLWEAGARFEFEDRRVAFYWFTPRSEASAGWVRGQLEAAANDIENVDQDEFASLLPLLPDASRDDEIAALEQQLVDVKHELANARHDAEEARALLAETGQRLVALETQAAELVDLRRRYDEVDAALAEATELYRGELAERDRQIEHRDEVIERIDGVMHDMQASISWRLTGPIRALKRAAKRLFS